MSRSNAEAVWQGPPPLILSARPFLGVSGRSKDADLDCLVRFAKPEAGAALLKAAAERGVGAIAPLNDPTMLRALEIAHTSCGLQVYPVIPNVIGYVREATDYGMVGAGIRQLRRMRLTDLVSIGLRRVTSVGGVLARDFPTILSLLIDLEMAAFRKFRPPLVLLHSQVTDIAVALGNHTALRVFADVVRRRFGAEPGVVTNNFGTLLPALGRWGLDIRVIAAPFNPSGFLMKPSKQVCESLLVDGDRWVIADRIAPDGAAALPEAFAYLQRLGIGSALIDAPEVTAIDLASSHHRRRA